MYLIMDDLGLINIEYLYASQIREVQKKMGTIAESVPFVSGTVKRPAADVKETDEAIIVTMEVPGVNKDDVDVEIIGDELSVSAKRSMEPEEGTKATLCNSVLKITMPKVSIISKTKIGIEEGAV